MTDADPMPQMVLVGIPQIAQIAGVGSSAVGNWRKRHADFPTPKIQAPSGALFDLDEVERWLIENSKIGARVPASLRLWALADSARGTWQPLQFAFFCIAALVYLEACERATGEDLSLTAVVPKEASWGHIREKDDSEEFVWGLKKSAEQIESLNPELVGLLTPVFSQLSPGDAGIARSIAIALDNASNDTKIRFGLLDEIVAPSVSARHTARSGLAARGGLAGSVLANLLEADRFAAVYHTPDDISYLVCQLVGTSGGTIFDPAVGEGGLLLLAGLWQRGEASPPRLVGIEKNEAVWRITRSRYYLYNIQADIRLGDALGMDLSQLPKADSVVLDPPYGQRAWGDAQVYVDTRWSFGSPPPNNADFAWLQTAVLQLKSTGHAGVVLPAGTLFNGGREAAIRRALIEAGVIEGIVLLPPRLRTDTSIPLAIWLLRSPKSTEKCDEILLVDGSDLARPGRSQFVMKERVIDRLGDILQAWRARRDIEPANAGIAAAVSITSIVDTELDPRRYRKRSQTDVAAMEKHVQELRRKAREDAAQVHVALEELVEHLGGAR